MAVAGRLIDDEELVEYILTGLNPKFESLVTSLALRVEPVSVDELYSHLLNFETRMDLYRGGDQGSANTAGCGGRGGRGRSSTPTRGGHGGFGLGGCGNTTTNNGFRQGGQGRQDGQGGYSNKRFSTNDSRPMCQVCYKGHAANECWHRFDEEFVPEERHVAAADNLYGINTNWYMDTGVREAVSS